MFTYGDVFQEKIQFEVIGDYPAPSFFKIGNNSGDVSIKSDLKADNLKSTKYTVRIAIYSHSLIDEAIDVVLLEILVTR